MWPRFRLRWVLIGFAAVAVLLYVLVVRPTVLAERFVVAANARDFAGAKALFRDQSWMAELEMRNQAGLINSSKAKLLPREWSDLWRSQRRIVLRIERHDPAIQRHVVTSTEYDLTAHCYDLKAALYPRAVVEDFQIPVTEPDVARAPDYTLVP